MTPPQFREFQSLLAAARRVSTKFVWCVVFVCVCTV